MKDKQRYIRTWAGLQIQLYILLAGAIAAYGYAWISHTRINQAFIVVMLRSFIMFADLGMFLAIGYLVDFKRGIGVGYVYKVMAFLQMDEVSTISEFDFVIKTVGKAFALVLYYKVTLFLIVYVASYIVQIDHQQAIAQKRQTQEETKKLIASQKEQGQKMFSKVQRQQIYGQLTNQTVKKNEQKMNQIQKTINRIKLSLRYHKQDEFYRKLEIFYFIFYNSVCVLWLFPLQEYVLDFGKVAEMGHVLDLLRDSESLRALNSEVMWYINFSTVWSVVMCWSVVMIGEFKIKTNYPALVKQYILSIPIKFLCIQLLSLLTLIVVLITTPIIRIGDGQQPEQQNNLMSVINYELLGVAYLIHTLLPLFIIFLLLRLYLGQTYTLNKLVSRKFSYHDNTSDDNSNLDAIIYECVTLDDITKVRHFTLSQTQLLSRHKLKRYAEEQKLKQYVNQEIILEIQSLFEDHLVLDLYNKLSRFIAVPMFYITLVVFLISLNINDTYFVTQDQFFTHNPVILLCVGMFFLYKYQSSPNQFYPKVLSWAVKYWSQFLANRKAFNLIRLTHFYAVIFTIWAYRIYSQIFLPTHSAVENQVKLTLYDYFSSPSLHHTGVMSSLLKGWADYYTTHSSSCDYDLLELYIDSVIVFMVVAQVLCQKHFTDRKLYKDDPIMLVLRIVAPIYACYVFVANMECLQWGRAVFCSNLCVGIAFMHVNMQQLERGVVRNQQGQYD